MNDLQLFYKSIKGLKKDPIPMRDVLELGKILSEEKEYIKSKKEVLYQLRELTQKARKLATDLAWTNLSGSMDFYDLYKDGLKYLADKFFYEYCLYLEFSRDAKRKFFVPREKQLKVVVDAFQQLEDDELDLVAVSMPPGTGKSTLEIFFMSYVIGKYGFDCNLMSGHSDKLTKGFYDGVFTIVTDNEEYMWQEIFPNAKLISQNAKDEELNLHQNKRFKSLTCRSIDGTLTGATRASRYLCADDLVSGIEQALSIDRMNSLWFKYTNDLASRKMDKAKEIHCATRWSVHDPIGRLELIHQDNPRAKFIVLPALDEFGKSNFEYMYGLGFSTEYFEDIKAKMDDISWRALYMNQPVEREGLLFENTSLNRYYQVPEGEPDARIGVCDTAESGKDYVVLPCAEVYGNDVYIVDAVCDDSVPTVTEIKCATAIVKNQLKAVRFESNTAGGRYADSVLSKLKELNYFCAISKKYTTTNKQTRIIVTSPFILEHFYFKDPSMYKQGSDYDKFIKQLTSYTIKGKVKNDDVPDACSMLVDFVGVITRSNISAFKRPC